jgi:predicted N-acetyltransferase YhbS
MNGIYLDVAGPEVLEFFAQDLHRSYGPGRSYASFAEEMAESLEHAWARDFARVLVLRDERGNYLSSLQLHAVRALRGEKEIWVGGITELVTPERLRGQGHASALLRLTLDVLAQEDVEGAFTWCGGDTRLFTHLGFRDLPVDLLQAPLQSIPDEPRGSLTVREIRSDDWPAIREVHHRCGIGQPLWLLRDEQRWDYLLRRWMRRSAAGPMLGRVALAGDSVVGYLLSQIETGRLRVLEFGLSSPDPRILGRMLASARASAEVAGCSIVLATRPPGRWGVLLETFLGTVSRAPGHFLVASVGEAFHPEKGSDSLRGYWEIDRI